MKKKRLRGSRALPAAIGFCVALTFVRSSLAGPYSDYLQSLEPVAWWRFNEISASAPASDSSGRGHHGTYVNSPVLGGAGALIGQSGTSVRVDANSAQYVSIPDSDDLSLVKGQDNFDRTVSAGTSWGTGIAGGGWSAAFTTSGSYYSCNGTLAAVDQSSTSATWGQVLGVVRADVDVQVKAKWTESAEGATTIPVALMARYIDSQNYYRAELRENVGGTLDLRITKVVAGTATALQTVSGVGTYVPKDEWYVRFQVDGETLRASAWKSGANLAPWIWQIERTDTSLGAAGRVGIRSANSGATSRPTVFFDEFRLQSIGMTVLGWMRPDSLIFPVDPDTPYIHWLSKGEPTAQEEYAFRFYTGEIADRPNRLSAYVFNPIGAKGAGAYIQDALTVGTWIFIAAIYDPGDVMDSSAGVTIYRDGIFRQGPATSKGTKYSNPDYSITPTNGTAVLRIGASHLAQAWTYFTGGIDEVAFFDRRLTAEEIATLYSRSQ